MSTATVTRIAIRFAQVLTLALLLVGLAGGAKVARAGALDYEVGCDEAAPWVEETLERYEIIEEHEQDLRNVTSVDQMGALVRFGVELYADAAEGQASSNPPGALEPINEDLTDAYQAVSDAISDLLESTADLDQDGAIEASESLYIATQEVHGAIYAVEKVPEFCEESGRGDDGDRRDDEEGGRDDDDRRREQSDEVEVEFEAEAVDADSGDEIEEATLIVLQEGIAFEDFDLRDYLDGDEDQVLATGVSDEDGKIDLELDVEVDGEYTIILLHEDYKFLTYWEEVVIADDEDADGYDFGTMTLSNELEEED